MESMDMKLGLLPEQSVAASHEGSHAVLLAGPGTGKTTVLTARIAYLVKERDVNPEHILAITFTRAAAHELSLRVSNLLGAGVLPRVSTLHSFALRQIFSNLESLPDLPTPIRIATDWEERHIIWKDLKAILEFGRVDEVRKLFNELSAGWQSLTADDSDWEKRFPNAQFLGAWQEHRAIYGYTLRNELVYQLKRGLEQSAGFDLEGPTHFLFVDEYQDLNRCDLQVIRAIVSSGAELFAAGDDDQSIYGFRKAHPDGIRRFDTDYAGSKRLTLRTCMRCDRHILELGKFVANLDPRRIDKEIHAKAGSEDGTVAILGFENNDKESTGITELCAMLMAKNSIDPGDILILLRSDRHGVYSEPIREKLLNVGIPVAVATNDDDSMDWLALHAFMRLAVSLDDSLAWRTLLQVWCKGIGNKTIHSVYQNSQRNGQSFAQTIAAATGTGSAVRQGLRGRSIQAVKRITERLAILFPNGAAEEYGSRDELMAVIGSAVSSIVADEEERKSALSKIERAAGISESRSIAGLTRALDVSAGFIEQELDKNKLNILTMHKAKGLTAKAVIVAAAEDQLIPGRAKGLNMHDERRLLYVSLTRAKHFLFITYCNRRTGRQMYTGSRRESPSRSLTQFLTHGPITPDRNGERFIHRMKNQRH